MNNAGVNRDRTIRRMSVEEWNEVIATDLSSIFYCTYAAVPHMIERGGGRIVNMSSIVGQMGNLGQSNYAAAKAGIVGFSKSAAQELAQVQHHRERALSGLHRDGDGHEPDGGRTEGASREGPARPLRQARGSGPHLPLPRHGRRVHHGGADQHQRRDVHAVGPRSQESEQLSRAAVEQLLYLVDHAFEEDGRAFLVAEPCVRIR